jgi:hypothetical protein
MNNQGLVGALIQYWTVDEKPRLHRRNTYFDDVQVDNVMALKVGIVVSMVATAIVVFWSLMGVIL